LRAKRAEVGGEGHLSRINTILRGNMMAEGKRDVKNRKDETTKRGEDSRQVRACIYPCSGLAPAAA
jgi:hypothetical protein